MQHNKFAQQLTDSLNLSMTPVAIAFSDGLPDELASFDAVVPAGCSFWEKAMTQTFVTTTDDHALCAVGMHTHQMADAPATQMVELQASLAAMIGLDYVREAEVAAIPVMQKPSRHVVYGPLADFPLAADCVLLFANAQQGLILSEALARVDEASAPAMGRPACAVIPQVINSDRAAVSLGCCGARAYLGALSDNVALWALPGSKLADYCQQIETLGKANGILAQFHQRRGGDIASGERPSVEQSLQRLAE